MTRTTPADDPENEQKNEAPPAVHADHDSLAVGSLRVEGDVQGPLVLGHGNVVTTGFSPRDAAAFLDKIQQEFQPRPFDGSCPYKGLEVFTEADVDLFFGREALVQDLLRRVSEARAVFVTGPSGSGKSSLVRAGLIPALKRVEASRRWLYATLTPERDPFEALARAFSRLKDPSLGTYFREHAGQAGALNDCAESALSDDPNQRLVLFVDQFEEVFTQLHRGETQAFVEAITHAAAVENGRVILLFSLRSDFLPICQTYPGLNALLGQKYAFAPIGGMGPEELASAIARPALGAGLQIDPALVAQIVHDMQGEPGALPLMQFALKDLFDSQQARGGVIALRLDDYVRQGGLHNSLERHADRSFARLTAGEQALARSVFGKLIEIGRGTQDTRRTALFEELVPAGTNPDEIQAVVQKLAAARLVITDEKDGKDTLTIAHEKLIEAWPWLKKLVDENREAIGLQNEIAGDAKEWDDHGRDASYLYTGARLANVRETLEGNKLVLSGQAYDFVNAGQAQQRRSQRTRAIAFAIPIGLVIVLMIAYIFSTNSANLAIQNAAFAKTQGAVAITSEANAALAQANAEEAQKLAKIARSAELAVYAVSQRDQRFDWSLLLSVEAFHTADTAFTRSVLLGNNQINSQLVQYFQGHGNSVSNIAFSPDGRALAAGSRDGTITLWNVASGQPIGQPLKGHSDAVNSVALSPDGKTLASGSDDTTIILWNVESGQTISPPLQGNKDWVVLSVVFSPDGKTLAAGSEDGTITLWNMASGQPIGQPLKGHSDDVTSVAFSRDGKTLASGSNDDTIILWDVASRQPIGQPLEGHSYYVSSIVFSPDGKTLASGSEDGTIILWDVANQKPSGQPLQDNSPVMSIAFSPDGKTLASGNWDETIILWDVASRQSIGQPLKGLSNGVTSVVFSPDGKTLASGSANNTILLWDVSTLLNTNVASHPSIEELLQRNTFINSIAFSSDGKTLVTGNEDGTVILWDVASRQLIGQPLKGHSNGVKSVAFSPDGKTLASGSSDQSIILWDVSNALTTSVAHGSGQPVGQSLRSHTNGVTSVAFSSDGKILASGSKDNTIILWDVASRQPIGQPLKGHSDAVNSVAFSPDGKALASGSKDDTIILWDVASHRAIGHPLQGNSNVVTCVAFSPDGKTLASGNLDGTVILWDVKTHQPLGEPLKHGDWILSVAFSPDGKTLASGSTGIANATIILWDVKTHQPLGEPLKHGDWVSSVAFSPDGNILASGSSDKTMLWDVNPKSWAEKSCQRVGRNFTHAEWATYFPDQPYPKKQADATCPQWPLEPEATPVASRTP